VIPLPHCLELNIGEELININEYINNFTPIDVRPTSLIPTEQLVRAQFLASSVLSFVQSSHAKQTAKIQNKTGDPQSGPAWLGTVMNAREELLHRKISEIISFLAGSPGINPSSETICYWIWLCCEFRLYPEGAELFRKIDLRDEFLLTRQLGLACERNCWLGDTYSTPYTLYSKISEIRSFLAGSPGINPSNETICYWVWFCYEFGLYQEGAELYREINEDMILRDSFLLTRQLGLACEGRC